MVIGAAFSGSNGLLLSKGVEGSGGGGEVGSLAVKSGGQEVLGARRPAEKVRKV